MYKKIVILAVLILTVVLVFLALNPTEKKETIRVGWQPPWINQGQIALILQKTDLLQQNGVNATFTGFSFGPPMTEAALGGQLDLLFLGDQPAFNLISKDDSWKIVAPLVYYRSALLVPPGSGLVSLNDLRGKTIATGVGSTTYRDTLQLFQEVGISKEQVALQNLDVGQQLAFMQSAQGKTWGQIDAIAAYDPTVTIAVSKGFAKELKEYKSLGVIAVNKKFFEKHPDAVRKFLKSVQEAFYYYQNHSGEANSWYAEATHYEIGQELFVQMASVEPKLQPNSRINISMDDATRYELEKHLKTAIQLGLIKKELKIGDALLVIP